MKYIHNLVIPFILYVVIMLKNTCLNRLKILWLPMAFFTRLLVPIPLNKTRLLNAKADTLLKLLGHSWFMAMFPSVFGAMQCSLLAILLTTYPLQSLITKYLILFCFPKSLSIPCHLVYSGLRVLFIISRQDLINSRLGPLNVLCFSRLHSVPKGLSLFLSCSTTLLCLGQCHLLWVSFLLWVSVFSS